MATQQSAAWDDNSDGSLEERSSSVPQLESNGTTVARFARANPAVPDDMPEAGAVVRWKASAFGCRKGTTGRVKSMVSRDDGPALVIQSIWGGELTVSAKEYHFFFEACDPSDPGYAYWVSS